MAARFCVRMLSLFGLMAGWWPAIGGADDSNIDFNREIRPILSNRCFRCHGPDDATLQAGLRFDARDAAIRELESGHRAIVPHHPDQSELLSRVTSDDEFERMPPADAGDPLTADEVELLRRWIEQGAPFAAHWSYVAPQRPTLPADLSHPEWVRNPIDRFVLQRLDREGLQPAPEAERAALIRRVSLDLTGLPPTLEEVDRFLADDSPDAYENLVDRLLKSPAYGERWGHVWLDLARYADSAGYAQDPERTIWRYRDWVIQAINANMPFDQFTIEQIAGDLLPDPTEDQLIATAFHRNTMTNSEGGTDDEEFRVAAVVDRVNTTMEVWMGVTMACAQCHTHKYDPITQEEYFKLFAVFNNTEDADRGDEHPNLITFTEEQRREQERSRAEIAALERTIAEKAQANDLELPKRTGELKTRFVRIELPGEKVFLSLAEVQAFAGEKNVAREGKASQVSTDFNGPAELAIDGNTDGQYFEAKSTTHTAAEDNPWWEVDLGTDHNLERIVVWNRTDGGTGQRLKNFRVIVLDEQRRPVWLHTVSAAPNPNVTLNVPKTAEALNDAQQAELVKYFAANSPVLGEHQQQLDELKKQLADIKGVPTPIMRELPPERQRTTHIHIRGNFLDKGDEVTPGVPAAFHPIEEETPDRLALAKWLVSEENPLTGRVVVNRYWEHLFGLGLVETSEDFGVQGDLPSHPELLDFLATELMRIGWDTKQLVRMIVTSATYRQSSRVTPELQQRDPDNRLLARGPRFRLPAETIRDQSLFIAGLLSPKMYGPSVRPPRPTLGLSAAFGGSTDWQPSPGEDRYRRGLYTSWRRTTPYPSMVTFDAPSREVCTIRRISTNTPLQALVTLNDPAFVEAAQGLARRIVSEGGDSAEQRVVYGFRLCLSRHPHEQETAQLVSLYEQALERYRSAEDQARQLATDPLGPLPEDMDPVELAAWTVVGNVLLNLDELISKR